MNEFFLKAEAIYVFFNGIICITSKIAPIIKTNKDKVLLSLKISITSCFSPFSLMISPTMHKEIPQAKTMP